MLLSRTDSSSNQLVRMQFRALVDLYLISAVRHIGAALVGNNLSAGAKFCVFRSLCSQPATYIEVVGDRVL